MESTLIKTLPGYIYSEYLLVLKPNSDLQEKIMYVKKEFSKEYKVASSVFSKTNITLVKFVQFEMLEEKLINRVKLIASGYHPFKVSLKDFGSLPSHTLFINIESKQQVQNLVKALKAVQQLMKMDKNNKPHFMDNPHLVIARKLLPWQYEKGWLDYSHKYFTGHFIAENMLLLKKREGEKYYQAIQQFEFLNLPVNIKQGQLFM